MVSESKGTISTFEFFQRFPNEKTALEYIEGRRWKDGVVCPYCDSERTSRQRQYKYHQCKDCRKKFTVRTGTVFERSHIPLNKWLYAMYLLQTARKGISSPQLSKALGVTQKTSWFMLHRLREACNIKAERRMSGQIEVDETYIGGKEKNKHGYKKSKAGRGAVGKQAIMGMRERGGNVRAFPIDNTKTETLESHLAENVKLGSYVYTDEHPGYRNLGKFYNHGYVKHSTKEYVNGVVHTNGIESIWAVIKRGYTGVYHQWSKKHMTRYINEFVFRLNDRNVSQHTLQSLDSLVDNTIGKRLTYKQLTADADNEIISGDAEVELSENA